MLESVPLSTEDLEFKSPIEWEERAKGFFLENLWLTVKRSLTAPKVFFENLRRNGSYIRPLTYALTIEIFTAIISSLIWGGIFSGFLFGGMGHWGVLAADFKIFTIFSGIFFLILGLMASSLVYFWCALLLGIRSKFRTLFRMYAYSEGAVLFRLIPGVGFLIAEIYRLLLLFFGFQKVYRCSKPRALAASLLPALILIFLTITMSSFSLYHLLKA